MELKLKVLVGAHVGKELPIAGSKFLIGRAEDCHLRPKSEMISRHHCLLLVDEESAAVRDLGSRNGTYVNEERVLGERVLMAGDRLKVGPLEFEVNLVVKAKKLPKVTSIKDVATRTVLGATKPEPEIDEWLASSPTVDQQSAAKHKDSTEMVPPSELTPGEPTELMEMGAGETEEISMSGTMVNHPTVSNPQVDEQPKSPPKGPSKMPTTAKKSTADSREAAADTLRNFFRRR
jgi:pSer/pThr/pTyr-binding forkhead associated (FHA) protein